MNSESMGGGEVKVHHNGMAMNGMSISFVSQNNFLGEIPFDTKLEESLGKVDRLLGTVFARELKEIVSENLNL